MDQYNLFVAMKTSQHFDSRHTIYSYFDFGLKHINFWLLYFF